MLRSEVRSDTPPLLRFIVNDTTPEALEKIQADNPRRLLFFSDEISRLMAQLTRTGWQNMRGQLLEAWSGFVPHTSDRILRGSTHVTASCLSLLGGVQPAALARVLKDQRDAGDDGFLQRFTLLVAPDDLPFQILDREPDMTSQSVYKKICNAVADATFWATFPGESDENGSKQLHFSKEAQQGFYTWLEDLDNRRRLEPDPIMQGVLSKVGGETAALAALLSICDGIAFQTLSGEVGLQCLNMAILLYEKVLTHWKKILTATEGLSKGRYERRVFEALSSVGGAADIRTLQRKIHGSTAHQIQTALAFLEGRKWVRHVANEMWLANPLAQRKGLTDH